MNMLGHDYVSVDAHFEAVAHRFETLQEQIAGYGRIEHGLAVTTAEGEEVGLARLV
jgi:hypothetical protein